MAKHKRKPSSAQRDKLNIAVASYLKKVGIISKQAKLHGGHYISPTVLKKAKEYQAAARLNYTTVKVDKATARAAKERGYQVVQGNRIIGPKTPTFRNRLKAGKLTGVKPVRGGYMEEIQLPHTIYDIRSLIEQLKEGGIDTLKMADEQFAFKYHGGTSYRAFLNSQDLLNALMRYQDVARAMESKKPEDLQEQFEAITLFRLHRDDITRAIPGPKERAKAAIERRAERIRNGEYVTRRRKKTRAEYLETLDPRRAAKIREKAAEYDRARREKIKNNPAIYERMKERAKARAKASRERNKK